MVISFPAAFLKDLVHRTFRGLRFILEKSEPGSGGEVCQRVLFGQPRNRAGASPWTTLGCAVAREPARYGTVAAAWDEQGTVAEANQGEAGGEVASTRPPGSTFVRPLA